MPRTAGRLVTETLRYDRGRAVSACVPAKAPEAVVFAGDGQLIAPWGQLLEAEDNNAVRWAKALQDTGTDVAMVERDGSHGDPFWREELPTMVSWAFRPRAWR